MNNLQNLIQYFNNGSADTERNFLMDVFAPSKDFVDIISFPTASCRLLIGNKGSGKSALLEYVNICCEENKIMSLYLTPDEIIEEDFDESASLAFIVRRIREAIVRTIASKIGEQQNGLSNEMNNELHRLALADGQKEPSVVEKILAILKPIGTRITSIDFDKMSKSTERSSAYFLNAIKNNLEQNNCVFYIMLDDVDQVANRSNKNYYDVIWGTILAFRKIASSLPNIRPIITLRTEVWRNLIVDANGTRDQIDHIRNMVYTINPTEDDIRNILQRRLVFAAGNNCGLAEAYGKFFYGKTCKMPRTNAKNTWEVFLVTSSRERPRDTVQLVNKLANHAIKANKTLIDEDDIEETALEYSRERAQDLVQENKDLCNGIEAVIRSFAKISFENTTNDLLNFLENIPSTASIIIQKRAMHQGDKQSAFAIWRLLYNVEFLTARVADSSKAEQYRYIRPAEDNTLVTENRWNDMQKCVWDVHPCYRVYLMDIADSNQKMQLIEKEPNVKGKKVKQRKQ